MKVVALCPELTPTIVARNSVVPPYALPQQPLGKLRVEASRTMSRRPPEPPLPPLLGSSPLSDACQW